MNIPTGMNYGTALHFHNVAAQMHAFSNNHSRQNLLSANGLFRQQQVSPYPFHGGPRLGYGPMMNDQFGDFARNFMRTLLQ